MPQRITGDRTLISTLEASTTSGLSREYIQRLVRQGRVEGIKLGHDWLVYEESLQLFLAHPRKPGPKGPHKYSLSDKSDTSLADSNNTNHDDESGKR
jgi:excisionase family DNA binding protein